MPTPMLIVLCNLTALIFKITNIPDEIPTKKTGTLYL